MEYTVCQDIAARDVDDELILLNCETGCYYSLNTTGREVWRVITDKKKVSHEMICRELQDLFAVSSEKLQKDVQELLQELVSEQLINTCT